jgi:hypothetical protein
VQGCCYHSLVPCVVLKDHNVYSAMRDNPNQCALANAHLAHPNGPPGKTCKHVFPAQTPPIPMLALRPMCAHATSAQLVPSSMSRSLTMSFACLPLQGTPTLREVLLTVSASFTPAPECFDRALNTDTDTVLDETAFFCCTYLTHCMNCTAARCKGQWTEAMCSPAACFLSAAVNVFGNADHFYQPAFIFPGKLGKGYAKYVWEAVSHGECNLWHWQCPVRAARPLSCALYVHNMHQIARPAGRIQCQVGNAPALCAARSRTLHQARLFLALSHPTEVVSVVGFADPGIIMML